MGFAFRPKRPPSDEMSEKAGGGQGGWGGRGKVWREGYGAGQVGYGAGQRGGRFFGAVRARLRRAVEYERMKKAAIAARREELRKTIARDYIAAGANPGVADWRARVAARRASRLMAQGYLVQDLTPHGIATTAHEAATEKRAMVQAALAQKAKIAQARAVLAEARQKTGLGAFLRRQQEMRGMAFRVEQERARALYQQERAAQAAVKTRLLESGLRTFAGAQGGGLFGPPPEWLSLSPAVSPPQPAFTPVTTVQPAGGGLFGPGPAWLRNETAPAPSPPPAAPSPPTSRPQPPSPLPPAQEQSGVEEQPSGAVEPQKVVAVRTYFRRLPSKKKPARVERPKTKAEILAELARSAMEE